MTGTRKALVVEDEGTWTAIYRAVLSMAGYEVRAIGSLDRAGDLLSEGVFDVLVLDDGVPFGGGFEKVGNGTRFLLENIGGQGVPLPHVVVMNSSEATLLRDVRDGLRERTGKSPFCEEESVLNGVEVYEIEGTRVIVGTKNEARKYITNELSKE